MDGNDKLRLRSNFRYLVGQLRVSDIRDYLFEKGVLNEDDHEELEQGRRTERNKARVLIKMLFKKGPKAYSIFCDSLVEAGYQHVVLKLESTDLSNVQFETEDELDHFLNDENQIAELSQRLWKVTEMLDQYKRDVDNLKKELKTREEFNTQFRALKKKITENGYTEEYIIDCLNTYMRKVQEDYTDSSQQLDDTAGRHQLPSPKLPESASKQAICRIAIELSRDIVQVMTADPQNVPPEPNRYAKTMRRMVQMMIETKGLTLQSFIKQLSVTEMNDFEILKNVADEMFGDGLNNWGRIVALYAFGGLVAKYAHENKMTSISKYIGDYLGKYVAKNKNEWIGERGGWDDFEKFFTETESQRSLGWMTLFITAVGLGALVSLASVKGSI